MIERQFQVRSIGTQEITLESVVSKEDSLVLIRNANAIFRLSGLEATQREDEKFDVRVKLTPDNGMATITEYPPDNPISGS